jgi:predicted site-specific integrase-resolvase
MGKVRLPNVDTVTINSIGEYCGVSPITVKRWIDRGQLHAIKLPSGRNRVTVQDLKYFLEQNHFPISKELLDVD